MRQPGLFAFDDANNVAARFHPSYEGWREQARRLLSLRTAPQSVHWVEDDAETVGERVKSGRVNAAFSAQAAAASCYRAADRWALLYRLAWRLTFEQPHLLDLAGDPDVLKLKLYAGAVRRDAHKMKAFVRFRESPCDQLSDVPSHFVAWFEPEHLIVEYTAPFFRDRFANMAWSILTPDRCAHYAGHGSVWFTGGARKDGAPDGDGFEDAWRSYYRSIFNPARLKWRAMQSEMPQKYWKNLPEAAEIGGLVHDASPRVQRMREQAKAEDILQCGPRPPTQSQQLEARCAGLPQQSLARLRLAATACQDCHLADSATQVVFGEGPEDARMMLIGEQPGDAEDLAGRPFVGPAGEVLDRALKAAGLARNNVYITNAVKHFKFKPSGKRRLHQRPDSSEVLACEGWLASEISLVNPEVIVCLGLTAAQAVLRTSESLLSLRGHSFIVDGREVIATVHPAHVLRRQDPRASAAVFASLVADLERASQP